MTVAFASNSRPAKSRARARRSGHLTAEALLVVPMLLLISISIVEIGLVVSLKQSVIYAATRAVREATQGADNDGDLDATIEEALSGFNVRLNTDAGNPGNAGYRVDFGSGAATIERGEVACDAPPTAISGDKICVTVCVKSSGSPVSGLISKFGATDFMEKVLTNRAVAKNECP